jgi:hypothetical protein
MVSKPRFLSDLYGESLAKLAPVADMVSKPRFLSDLRGETGSAVKPEEVCREDF